MVMPALVSRINTAKTLLYGQLDQTLGIVFLPGRPVKESRDADAADQ